MRGRDAIVKERNQAETYALSLLRQAHFALCDYKNALCAWFVFYRGSVQKVAGLTAIWTFSSSPPQPRLAL